MTGKIILTLVALILSTGEPDDPIYMSPEGFTMDECVKFAQFVILEQPTPGVRYIEATCHRDSGKTS